MKINSITTQELDAKGRIVATSKRVFKKKPDFVGYHSPLLYLLVQETVERHQKQSEPSTVEWIVTVSTSKGKYVQAKRRFA